MDKNKDILRSAIDNLQEYDPPDLVWENINATLVKEKNEEAIERVMLDLPTYEPADSVWSAIQSELAQDVQNTQVRKLPIRRWLAYAAAIALVVSASFWVLQDNGTNASETFALTQEKMPILQSPNWDEDAEDFEVVLTEIDNNQVLSQNTDVSNLRYEYVELETARKEIMAMMEQYGTDAAIIEQMNDIERERTKVIKQLVNFLVNVG